MLKLAMQEGGNFSGFAAAIIDGCYHMARDFSHVRCEHCHRKGNSVAHEFAIIAKFLHLVPGLMSLLVPSPLCLYDATLITAPSVLKETTTLILGQREYLIKGY